MDDSSHPDAKSFVWLLIVAVMCTGLCAAALVVSLITAVNSGLFATPTYPPLT